MFAKVLALLRQFHGHNAPHSPWEEKLTYKKQSRELLLSLDRLLTVRECGEHGRHNQLPHEE